MDFPVLREDDSISQYQILFVELWKDVCNHDCTKLEHISVISQQFHRLMKLLHKNVPPNDSISYAIYQHNVFQLFVVWAKTPTTRYRRSPCRARVRPGGGESRLPAILWPFLGL